MIYKVRPNQIATIVDRRIHRKQQPGGRGHVLYENLQTQSDSMDKSKPISDAVELTATEKVVAGLPHVIEQTLTYMTSGFAKIDLINSCPSQRGNYEHVISDLSTYKQNDNYFLITTIFI